jgi:hypothetical protein
MKEGAGVPKASSTTAVSIAPIVKACATTARASVRRDLGEAKGADHEGTNQS